MRHSTKKLPGNQTAKNRLIGVYKQEAIKKNVLFTLTEDEFFSLTSSDCYYCGVEPKQVFKPSHYSSSNEVDRFYIYNGIDRVDSNRGYEKDNCLTSCCTCNFAKRSMSKDQFLKWVKRIYINQYHKATELTPGQLIDLLFTTDYKTWWAQEDIMKYKDSDPEKAAAAAVRAQEMNAKRTKLIRTIDEVLDFTEDTNTEKTYSDGNIEEKENYTYFKNYPDKVLDNEVLKSLDEKDSVSK